MRPYIHANAVPIYACVHRCTQVCFYVYIYIYSWLACYSLHLHVQRLYVMIRSHDVQLPNLLPLACPCTRRLLLHHHHHHHRLIVPLPLPLTVHRSEEPLTLNPKLNSIQTHMRTSMRVSTYGDGICAYVWTHSCIFVYIDPNHPKYVNTHVNIYVRAHRLQVHII